MADLIDRQAAIETLNKLARDNFTFADAFSFYLGALHDAADNIKQLPSADVVEVVRCKDCYHYDEESEKCILNNSDFKPTDYCSYGSK